MKSFSYFYSSFASFIPAWILGYYLLGIPGLWLVTVLAILEVSLSLDNAVVNASVLEHWNQAWRRLFLLFGLPIAVFGMRLIFPILIVAFTTGLGIFETVRLAVFEPDAYAQAIMAVHHEVAAFGGAFLMMVALKFFIDQDKEHHWLPWIEPVLARLGAYEVALEAGITLAFVWGMSLLLHGTEQHEFLAAGVFGFIVYIVSKALGQMLTGGEKGGGKIVAQGVGGLLYLEILDASFSLDGVIGAFAISNNLLIIMAGLGVGAMFVRSLTIYLVDKGTLGEYRYLEHGAFWALGALAVIMFAGVVYEIPETVTGLIGAATIALSFWSSVRANRRDAAAATLQQ